VGIADLAGVLWLSRRRARPDLVEDAVLPEAGTQSARPAEAASRKASAESVP
jgi:hypothetical protein